MDYRVSRILALVALTSLATTASSESHVEQSGGASAFKYGNDECNNSPSYLKENDLACVAVFSDTNVWDLLDGLPRRITLDTFVELNPLLIDVDYDTVITGITFVRVQ